MADSEFPLKHIGLPTLSSKDLVVQDLFLPNSTEWDLPVIRRTYLSMRV